MKPLNPSLLRGAVRAAMPLLLAFSLLHPATAVAADAGEIQVEVASADTRRPVAGVNIVVTARDGTEQAATTGPDGVATIDKLDTGLYSLTASRAGLVTGFEPSVRVVSRKATPIKMALETRDTNIDEIVVVARAAQADATGAVSNFFFNREELRSAAGRERWSRGTFQLRSTEAPLGSRRQRKGSRRSSVPWPWPIWTSPRRRGSLGLA